MEEFKRYECYRIQDTDKRIVIHRPELLYSRKPDGVNELIQKYKDYSVYICLTPERLPEEGMVGGLYD